LFLAPLVAGGENIPVEILGRIPFLKATLNGHGPFPMIIDTGATETIITPPTAKAAGLTTYPAIGNQRAGTLDSLIVGNVRTEKLTVFVFDPPQAVPLRLNQGIHYAGILGHTFLSRFIVTLDYPGKTLQLLPEPAGFPPRPATNAIPFELRDNHIQLQTFINGKGPFRFILDTGAAETVILPATAKAMNLAGTPFLTLETIKVGAVEARQVDAIIHLPTQDQRPALSYHGILGHSFLSHYRITIQYRTRHVTLELPGDAPKNPTP
jgi:predicted aspartyl protease